MLPSMGFPGHSVGKECVYNAGDTRGAVSVPGSGRFPWRRAWQPTLVPVPGEIHGQRSQQGYRPQGHKRSDMNEANEHINTLPTIYNASLIQTKFKIPQVPIF